MSPTVTERILQRPNLAELAQGMKAISLTEPWASLVALGWKRCETRSWPTKYRGWLAIHAAKSIDLDMTELAVRRGWLPRASLATMATAPSPPTSPGATRCGHVVAIAQLVHVQRVTGLFGPLELEDLGGVELELGDYAVGRHFWRLANVWRLGSPVPAKGKLQLWDWAPPAEMLLHSSPARAV